MDAFGAYVKYVCACKHIRLLNCKLVLFNCSCQMSRSRRDHSRSRSPKSGWVKRLEQQMAEQLLRLDIRGEAGAPDQRAARRGSHVAERSDAPLGQLRGGSSASASASSGDGNTYSAGSYSGGSHSSTSASSGDGYAYRQETIAHIGDGSLWLPAYHDDGEPVTWWDQWVPKKWAHIWVFPSSAARASSEMPEPEPEDQNDQKDQSMTTEAREPE